MTAPVSPPQPSTDDALSKQIAKIDHLLEREEHDAGYSAFVYMRKIWPDLRSHASLKARAEQAEQSVDVLESNARVQAKLLADMGRRVEELEAALRPFAEMFDVVTEQDLAVAGIEEMSIQAVLYEPDQATISDLRTRPRRPRAQHSGGVAMTHAQKSALAIFAAAGGPVIPQYAEMRKDVARKLYDAGYVECFRDGDTFRAGYAPLKITNAGRAALPHVRDPAREARES